MKYQYIEFYMLQIPTQLLNRISQYNIQRYRV